MKRMLEALRSKDGIKIIILSVTLMIVILAIWLPKIFFYPAYHTGLRIRFLVVYPFYEAAISASPAAKCRVRSLSISVTLVAGFVIVYDETERIARPFASDIDTNKLNRWINGRAPPQCWGTSYHLFSHYYACTYWEEI